MSENIFVVDTSLIVSDPEFYSKIDNQCLFIIPICVIEELDNLKTRQDFTGYQARKFIRFLNSQFSNINEDDTKTFSSCVRLENGSYISIDSLKKVTKIPFLDAEKVDNQIILFCLEYQKKHKKEIALLTNDLTLKFKAVSYGVFVFFIDSEEESSNNSYEGNSIIELNEEDYAFFQNESKIKELDGFFFEEFFQRSFCPNEFIILKLPDIDEERDFRNNYNVFQFKESKEFVRHLKLYDKKYVDNLWGFSPRTLEQLLAVDLILDDSIPLVSLAGLAGCGKTLCSLAGALQQLNISGNNKKKKGNKFSGYSEPSNSSKFGRLIISRPNQEVGKSLGYLPGDIIEKISPHLMPIVDNLRVLFGNDKETIDDYLARGIFEIEPIAFIRGRSIHDSFMIVDEAQNASLDELKTILTRIGEGSKIVLAGDLRQSDIKQNSGLNSVIQKFAGQKIAGHLTMKNGERSSLATIAANIL